LGAMRAAAELESQVKFCFFFVRPTDFPSAKFHAMNPFGTEF